MHNSFDNIFFSHGSPSLSLAHTFIFSKISLFFAFTLEPSPLYDNNHYHEECLRCNSCGINLSGQNHKRARRFKNQILCDLHFADVALMECSDFMQQLRSFKPQSLGCAVARRKSSTTLIFPLPPHACSGKFNVKNRKKKKVKTKDTTHFTLISLTFVLHPHKYTY